MAGRDRAPGDQAELGAPGEERAAAPAETRPGEVGWSASQAGRRLTASRPAWKKLGKSKVGLGVERMVKGVKDGDLEHQDKWVGEGQGC